jgi:uncharacterized membrane protein
MVGMRLFRHLTTGKFALRRHLPLGSETAISAAVTEAERGHSAEIRVIIEARRPLHKILWGETARRRAIDVFALERVWDTEHNNGVLLYLLVAERDAEIVADRGINPHITGVEWESVCKKLEVAVRAGGLVTGVQVAVAEIAELLRREFPLADSNTQKNELSDDVVIR